VRARPGVFTEAVLGKPPSEYCSWILDDSKWGGEIELYILSQHYQAEIVAVEIRTLHCYTYGVSQHSISTYTHRWLTAVFCYVDAGEGEGYSRRIYVLCEWRPHRTHTPLTSKSERTVLFDLMSETPWNLACCVSSDDGVHYDPMALAASASASESMDTTQFPAGDDEGSKEKVLQVARDLKQVRWMHTCMQAFGGQVAHGRCAVP
jgi:hypothetical protein